ncbi:ParB/RepB/Spo0J family partition protein [Hyphobacterium sp. HN65]|uniref:ParB/RepB/Spo0J family partition protein n=1 Tax=Hyphobacterium lacteum TaxID=3116575 RepID=A0ABU7LRS5_9PROT|nr:ParB/RepB/Spo0J family partition protein [Hyphobacterium sp. HN65]MEE2526617.1 ParB/RepB/Spo0J family partition protein [Hyphobacterium sp. HN65]
MSAERTRGLGRGLSALLNDGDVTDKTADSPRNASLIPIEEIQPNPDQPRRIFAEDDLKALAASITEKGLLQPVLVRPLAEGGYQIVAGERRWRAAQLAKLHEIPVLVRELTDRETLEIAIVENVQRADLNPVEEARAYRQLVDRFEHTQEEIARAVGKSRSHVANMMRLLSLPDSVLEHLAAGRLSMGHARAIATSENAAVLADNIAAQGLSVRQAEALAKAPAAGKAPETKSTGPSKDADTRALEDDLSHRLGLKVEIDHGHGKSGEAGAVTIRYSKLDQLDDICRRLNAG